MGEKSTFRGALEESRRLVREAALRAREAAEPRLKAVRETAEKLRDSVAPPRSRGGGQTVQGRQGVYEVQEKVRGGGLERSYTVLRLANGSGEIVGGFEIGGTTLSVRRAEGVPMSEMALVAAVWLEEPARQGR